jgi:hypothetical protein
MIKERGEEMEMGKENLTEFSSIPLPDGKRIVATHQRRYTAERMIGMAWAGYFLVVYW